MDSMDSALIDSQRLAEDNIVDNLLDTLRGHENFKRVQAFKEVDQERKHQDNLRAENPEVGRELVLLRGAVSEAEKAYCEGHESLARTSILIAATICIRCLENTSS